MKKLIRNLTLVLVTLLATQACKESDKSIDSVFDNVTRGATLRTMNVINGTIDIFNIETSGFEVELEYRDNEAGALFDSFDVYASFVDNTDDGVDNSAPEVFLFNVPGETFPINEEYGFPRGVLSIPASQTFAALGLSPDQLNGGDEVVYRLVLKLNDGREFTNNASGNVASGSFFSSPFAYRAALVCLFDEPDFFSGTYLLEQLNGSDPFFGTQTFGTQTVNIVADGINRDFSVVYYPGIFDSAYNINLDLICGDILVSGSIAAGGLSCGDVNIGQSTGSPVSKFDTNFIDDDVIEVNIEDFNPDGDCGTGGYQVTLRLTKQ